MPDILATVGLLVIKKRKLLLAFSSNKQCYYLPGGKIDESESREEALCREIQEELNVTLSTHDLKFYTHITAPAYGEKEGVIMEQDCYLSNKTIDPKPAAEIGAVKYFTLSEYLSEERTAPGAVMVLRHLKDENLID